VADRVGQQKKKKGKKRKKCIKKKCIKNYLKKGWIKYDPNQLIQAIMLIQQVHDQLLFEKTEA
jgi:hypothetical protein